MKLCGSANNVHRKYLIDDVKNTLRTWAEKFLANQAHLDALFMPRNHISRPEKYRDNTEYCFSIYTDVARNIAKQNENHSKSSTRERNQSEHVQVPGTPYPINLARNG